MKWLTLIAAIVAIVFALRILAADLRRNGRPRSTLRQLAIALLSLAVMGVAIYALHWIGFFSVPIVAAAFVPFGLTTRLWMLANRDTREARQLREEALAPVPPTRRDRFVALVRWPVFLVLIAIVLAAGLIAGMLAARY
jgi:hypothetical protein